MQTKLNSTSPTQEIEAQCTIPALKVESLDRVYFITSVQWQTLSFMLGESLRQLAVKAKTQSSLPRSSSDRLRFANEMKCKQPLLPISIFIGGAWSFSSSVSNGCHGNLTFSIPRYPRITNGIGSLIVLLNRLSSGLSNDGIGIALQIIPETPDEERIQRKARAPQSAGSVGWSMEDVVAILIKSHPVLLGTVEMNRSSLAPRSTAMFTLSAVLRATRILVEGLHINDQTKAVKAAKEFWTQLDHCFPDWSRCRNGVIRSSFLRENFVHTSAGVLAAIATATATHMNISKEVDLTKVMSPLLQIDWTRDSDHWSAELTAGGRVSKASAEISKLADYLILVLKKS